MRQRSNLDRSAWSTPVERRLRRLREHTEGATADSAFPERVLCFVRYAERDWGFNVSRVARRWIAACTLFVVLAVCWALQSKGLPETSYVEGPLPMEVWW